MKGFIPPFEIYPPNFSSPISIPSPLPSPPIPPPRSLSPSPSPEKEREKARQKRIEARRLRRVLRGIEKSPVRGLY